VEKIAGILMLKPMASCSAKNPLGIIEKYEFVDPKNRAIFKEFLEDIKDSSNTRKKL
jgi:hypothetical protein